MKTHTFKSPHSSVRRSRRGLAPLEFVLALPILLCVMALGLVPGVGLAAWAWFAMARVDEELRACTGFQGMHLER